MSTMRTLVAFALATLALIASAQPVMRLEPSAASGCLTASDPESVEPAYPFDEYKHGTAGRVLVELRFTGPLRRPDVKVLESSGGYAFVDAVTEHVRTLRAPCMATDAPAAVLRRDYVFQPLSDRVNLGTVQDANAERRRELLACIVNKNSPALPDYPRQARSQEIQGRVIARLTFTAPDQPPGVELVQRPSARVLAGAVAPWAQGYRMPCFVPGKDEALMTSTVFIFRLEGSGAYGFRPLTLTQFMGSVPNIGLRPLVADTSTMQCPFELRLVYRQPALRNQVYSVGPEVASREPLLEWLRGAAVNVDSHVQDSIFGDTADIAVPCVKINLKPKEKT